MSETNPIRVHEFLRGMDWPATPESLRRHAQKLGADESVLRALAGLPDGPIESPAALTTAIGSEIPPSGAGSGPRGLSSEGDDLGDHPAARNPPRG